MCFGVGEGNTFKNKETNKRQMHTHPHTKKRDYLIAECDSLINKKLFTITTSDSLGFIPKEHR